MVMWCTVSVCEQCMRSACACALCSVYMLHACALSRSKTTDELTLTTYAVGGRGGVVVSGDQRWSEACE